MVCQYCIKYNCRTVSVFAHSSVVCCCCCCSIVFFLVQIIITCEIIIIFFVCKLIYYLVSLGGVLPISLLWSHHEVMQFHIIYKVFFLFFLPLAQRLFALIRKQFENSFSSTFSLICLSQVCICDLNWLFSSRNGWELSPFCHQSHHIVKIKTRKSLLCCAKDIKFKIARFSSSNYDV